MSFHSFSSPFFVGGGRGGCLPRAPHSFLHRLELPEVSGLAGLAPPQSYESVYHLQCGNIWSCTKKESRSVNLSCNARKQHFHRSLHETKFNLFSDVFRYGNFPLEPKVKLRNFCKKHLLKGRLSTHPVISLKASSQLSIS